MLYCIFLQQAGDTALLLALKKDGGLGLDVIPLLLNKGANPNHINMVIFKIDIEMIFLARLVDNE